MQTKVGDFILDDGRGLLVNETGNSVAIRPQSLKVLTVLAQRQDQVVSKGDLAEAVWPGIAVTDDSLVQCIGDVRRALKDPAHKLLKTVPRRGYMLANGDTNPAQATTEPPRLAVLPFETHDTGFEERLAQGLAADLVTELARHRDISVIAGNSVRAFKASGEPESALPATLGVRYVLHGRLGISSDWVKLLVHLTDPETDKLLWSERFERAIGDVFDLEDMLASAIINRLVGTAGSIVAAGRASASTKTRSNLAAYDSYVLGLNIGELFTASGAEESLQHFKRAVEIDPDFGRAWQRLASIHLIRSSFGYVDDIEAEAAAFVEAAEKAASLDTNDAMTRATLAVAQFMQGEQGLGERSYEIAIELGPNDADALAFVGYTRPTKLPTASQDLSLIRRAMKLNPYYPDWYALAAGYAAFYAGEPQQAVDELRMVRSGIGDRHLYLALSLAALGRVEEAAEHRDALLSLVPDFTIAGAIHGDSIVDADAAKRFAETARLAGLPEGTSPTAA